MAQKLMVFGPPSEFGVPEHTVSVQWRLIGGKAERWGWLGDPVIPQRGLGGPAIFILPINLISPLCQYSVTSPAHIHIHTISF